MRSRQIRVLPIVPAVIAMVMPEAASVSGMTYGYAIQSVDRCSRDSECVEL